MTPPPKPLIYDRRPDETKLRARMRRDGVAGMLEHIIIFRNRTVDYGSYEVICTGVFSGAHLLTYYEANKNGSIRRGKRQRGRFVRTYRYTKPYRIAGQKDFEKLTR